MWNTENDPWPPSMTPEERLLVSRLTIARLMSYGPLKDES